MAGLALAEPELAQRGQFLITCRLCCITVAYSVVNALVVCVVYYAENAATHRHVT